jgi:hypothetical protein
VEESRSRGGGEEGWRSLLFLFFCPGRDFLLSGIDTQNLWSMWPRLARARALSYPQSTLPVLFPTTTSVAHEPH